MDEVDLTIPGAARDMDKESECTRKDEAVPPVVPPVVQGQNGNENVNANVKRWIIILAIVAVLIITIVALLVRQYDYPEGDDVPASIDFSTGVSLITYYGIEAKVESRLATTKLIMEVANAMDCSSVHAISLYLPMNTRVTSLHTIADDSCQTNGVVEELREARETFQEEVNKGASSAYVEVQDSFTYSVQVSIPPFGVTKVEMVVEQLLQQRLGEVKFEIPLIPNEEVDTVILNLTVEDVIGDPAAFNLDLNLNDLIDNTTTLPSNSTYDDTTTTIFSNLHLDIPDARQHDLPQVIRGSYYPGQVPAGGLLHAEGDCFEHFFQPSTLESMPRNFIFLFDTSSYSMSEWKLSEIVSSLSNFIDTLTPQDTFTIQTFGRQGTIELWGSAVGTLTEKEEAKDFLKNLLPPYNYGRSANLHEALLESLLRAKHNTEESRDDTASILVLISSEYASAGETNRRRIAETVFELNKEGKVKIFPIGFQDNADMELLEAIALMNGGISTTITEGSSDTISSQITDFLESEVGTVILSDVKVEFTGVNVKGETQNVFPLLTDGNEVIVRGLMELPEGSNDGMVLKAVTSAASINGKKEWDATADVDSSTVDTSSLCFHSYAHARISHLLRLYDATKLLGSDNEIVNDLVTLTEECQDKELADCIQAEALALALKANVVVEGLTAMVTVDDENCMSFDEDAEVCIDGTTPGDSPWHSDHSDRNYESSSGANGFTISFFPLGTWLLLLVNLLF